MQMPPLDPAILGRRAEIVAALRAIVPGEGVVDEPEAPAPPSEAANRMRANSTRRR